MFIVLNFFSPRNFKSIIIFAKLSPSRLVLALARLRLALIFNSPPTPTPTEKVVKPQEKAKPSLA